MQYCNILPDAANSYWRWQCQPFLEILLLPLCQRKLVTAPTILLWRLGCKWSRAMQCKCRSLFGHYSSLLSSQQYIFKLLKTQNPIRLLWCWKDSWIKNVMHRNLTQRPKLLFSGKSLKSLCNFLCPAASSKWMQFLCFGVILINRWLSVQPCTIYPETSLLSLICINNLVSTFCVNNLSVQIFLASNF